MSVPTIAERPWERKRYRVPRDDGAIYALPPLADAPARLAGNQSLLADCDVDIQGRSFSRLRRWARDAAWQAARAYTASWCADDIPDDGVAHPWVVTGHQPALFHPGVWVKNFAAGMLARRAQGFGLNIVVDNDTLSSTAVRAPAGSRQAPTWQFVPFDAPRPPQPWEEATILDRPLFDSFADRLCDAVRSWGFEPLVRELWPAAVRHASVSPRLADCLTAARNTLERGWGLQNLELPISHMARLDPFLWFASHLLAHLRRFREIYNAALGEYRRANHIRSHAHPVPELQFQDDWHEAPFWVWRAGDQRRGRVFARQAGPEVLLRDRQDVFARLPLSPEKEACCAVEVLRALDGQGIRLRTRALTTTLFARLFLCDLFLHGIGGSKYDEMTDRLIARFYGIEPPAFLTVSATSLLPLDPYPVRPADEVRLKERLRDLRWNPERHLPQPLPPAATALVAEWNAAVPGAAGQSSPAAAARHDRLRQLKRQLAVWTDPIREATESELSRVQQQLQANRVLRDREYAFCLYPAEKLRTLFAGLR